MEHSSHLRNYSLFKRLLKIWTDNTTDRVRLMMAECLSSLALDRIARRIVVPVDLDDPEPEFIWAVERLIANLVSHAEARRS